MKPFQAASSAVQVSGEAVLALVEGMGFGAGHARRVLAAHGIRDPQPGTWHRQQDWLDAFHEIARTLGPNALFHIGEKIPEMAQFPKAIASMEEGLAAIDKAYHLNHRGGPIGCYRFIPEGERQARVFCDNPYPSDLDRGIITAMARRFQAGDSPATVELDPAAPTRKDGGESCTFIVRW
jgi:hypothetical protein